jgi:TPR repeat protein
MRANLCTGFKLQMVDLTILALAAFRIPDVNDKTGRLPPSKHKDAAKRLIMACSQAKEPTATLHILRAILLSSSLPKAKDVAQNFSLADVRACRRELEDLVDQGNADAMTLLGQFLEQEGSKARARELYEQAVEQKEAASNTESEDRISQIAVPQIPPWNLLGQMLLQEKDPQRREQAEATFLKGALEGDDPLSYYHLATFQPQYSHDWLQYMTKAASAGHVDAAYQIANFYQDLNGSMNLHSETPKWAKEGKFAKSLRWLIQWKKTAPGELAHEWFGLAANKGHKPSMLELAEFEELSGRIGDAKSWLEKIIVSPPGKPEQWPQTVAEARTKLKKLAGRA